MSGTTRAHCNQCRGTTYHDVLAIENHPPTGPDSDDPSSDVYEFLRCRGCHGVSMRNTYRYYEDDENVVQYPAPISRRVPSWAVLSDFGLGGVPKTVGGLLTEIYAALQANARSLVAMGVRALLEAVMIDKVGDKGGFAKNLDAFQEAGYLSVRQRNTLETILEAGHATIHRGWRPSDNDVTTLMDIAESVVESAYLHEARASKLERAVPRRSRPNAPPESK